MIKRLINYIRQPLQATVIRRYKITSGNVGELYVAKTLVADSVDTYGDYDLSAYATARYGDFVQLKPKNVLYVNDKQLDGRRLDLTIRNNWVNEL